MSIVTAESLNKQFKSTQNLSFETTESGLVLARVSNPYANAAIVLQGAHIVEFTPHGEQPLLWLSEEAHFQPGKSIRGGVPLCWPWFGAHECDSTLPAHGYARTVDWRLIAARSLSDSRSQLEFELRRYDRATSSLYARYRLTIGHSLELELMTTNNGSRPIKLSNALHTYFNVSDVRRIHIQGFDHCEYIDTLEDQRHRQDGSISIDREIDRIYLGTPSSYEIYDPIFKRRLRIHTRNSHSAIVWNPWIAKSQRLGDMGKDGYLRMVCVETANAADDSIILSPQTTHCLGAGYQIMSI